MIQVCISTTDAIRDMAYLRKLKERGVDLIEIRADLMDDPLDGIDLIDRIRDAGLMSIVTLRPEREGGGFSGHDEMRKEIFLRYMEKGPDLIDLELDTDHAIRDDLVSESKRNGVKIIISHHDGRSTPPSEEIIDRAGECSDAGGNIVKLAFHAESIDDALELIKASILLSFEGSCSTVMGTGPYGWITRILSPFTGSEILYSCDMDKMIEGQIDLDTLNGYFGKREGLAIDENTELFGIIGDPISHSLSPLMHNTAFRELGINGVYIPFHVQTDDLGVMVNILKAVNITGFNVTIPHKQNIIPFLDDMDEEAGSIGAVNTVHNVNGSLKGYNTDVSGAMDALELSGIDLSERTLALMVGTGATARTISFGLAEKGVRLIISGRNMEKANALAGEIKGMTDVRVCDTGMIYKGEEEPDLIVNTTPIGMIGGPKGCPVDPDIIRDHMTVFDVVYTPGDTELIREACKRDATIVPGIRMLVSQGADSFNIWTGEESPVESMEKVVLRELSRRSKDEE